jgi:hypothetical protein
MVGTEEAKYIEYRPNMTSAWARSKRFDIPVDRYDRSTFPATMPQQNTGVPYLSLG